MEIMGMEIPTEWNEYKRVLQKASMPTRGDFKQVAFIAAIGVLLVGSIGFTIYVVMSLIPM